MIYILFSSCLNWPGKSVSCVLIKIPGALVVFYFFRILTGFEKFEYEDRLKKLSMNTLKDRRIRGFDRDV